MDLKLRLLGLGTKNRKKVTKVAPFVIPWQNPWAGCELYNANHVWETKFEKSCSASFKVWLHLANCPPNTLFAFAYIILTTTFQLRKRTFVLPTCNNVSSSVSCDIQDNLEHLIKCFTFLNITARNSTWKCNNMLITNLTHCLLASI